MELEEVCVNKVRINKCKVLVVDTCLGNKCPFKITSKQLEESNKYTNTRLATLNSEIQLYIAEKYYGGKMPWLKGEK